MSTEDYLLRRIATLLLLLSVALPLSASFRFLFDPETGSWQLRNSQIEAEYRLTPEGRFSFYGVRILSEAAEPYAAPAASCPIRIKIDSYWYDCGISYRLISQASGPLERGGFRQTILLRDVNETAEFQVDIDLYPDHPVIRQTIRFRNLDVQTVYVEDVGLMPLRLLGGGDDSESFYVEQWANAGRDASFHTVTEKLPKGESTNLLSGAHGLHCSWLAWRDNQQRGVFAGWEFNGKAVAALQNSIEEQAITLRISILDLHQPVRSQEEFVMPSAFFGLFQGDWDEASYATQKFVEAALAQPVDTPDFPYVIWDSWKYGDEIDEATMRRNAEIAAKLGIEVFVLDLGWARQIGEWVADPKKFPSGLKTLSDYVHSLGMKFGLHFPLAEANEESPVLQQHPEWQSTVSEGYYGARSLCLSHDPVKKWIIGETIRMVDDYGVDWILQDGENMVKQCSRPSHSHDPRNSNFSNSVNGLDAVIDEVQQQRPNVLWENCEDGGNMMTYSMVQRYVTSIAADDTGPLTTRQAIHGVTYPFSSRYADRYMPEEDLTLYNLRSYMFGGPWIFMNRLPTIKQQDLDLAQREILLYKQLRKRIREGRVYHLTERPSETGIDALQSYHTASDTSAIFVYRARSNDPSITLRPRGLRPDGRYLVTLQDTGGVTELTGAQIMEEGIAVSLPQQLSTQLLHIEPVPDELPEPDPQ